ncbi:hypothetical protein SDC9_146053 [bioreactor metagenome]|uniref:Uncharacterized protein n=1 Tax=bioreactor metagenome TaxID=1076179 RepID=A0A645EDM1_9ZZZZ
MDAGVALHAPDKGKSAFRRCFIVKYQQVKGLGKFAVSRLQHTDRACLGGGQLTAHTESAKVALDQVDAGPCLFKHQGPQVLELLPGHRFCISRFPLLIYTQRQLKNEGGALSRRAEYLDLALHHVDKVFDDG